LRNICQVSSGSVKNLREFSLTEAKMWTLSLGRLLVLRKVEAAPDFKAIDMCMSALLTGRIYPFRKYFWFSFPLGAESNPGA
jgi:hypothetical protein